MTEKDIARFWAKVDRSGADSCWKWGGFIAPDGYGRFWVEGSPPAYTEFIGRQLIHHVRRLAA